MAATEKRAPITILYAYETFRNWSCSFCAIRIFRWAPRYLSNIAALRFRWDHRWHPCAAPRPPFAITSFGINFYIFPILLFLPLCGQSVPAAHLTNTSLPARLRRRGFPHEDSDPPRNWFNDIYLHPHFYGLPLELENVPGREIAKGSDYTPSP